MIKWLCTISSAFEIQSRQVDVTCQDHLFKCNENSQEFRLFTIASNAVIHTDGESFEAQNPVRDSAKSWSKMRFVNWICSRRVKEVVSKGRNRVAVTFSCSKAANNFVANPELKLRNITAFIPSHLISCQGIIRNVHQSFSIDTILTNINSPSKVLKARRFNRKVTDSEGLHSYVRTQSVVLTFEGTSLPKKVWLFYAPAEVETYKFPVTQCFKCLHYGHTAKICKSKDRCINCGGEHNKEDCSNHEIKCANCKGSHHALDKSCPEFIKQKEIKELMAFHNISFTEAKEAIKGKKLTNILSRPQDFPPLSQSNRIDTSFSPLNTNNNFERSFVDILSPKLKKRRQSTSFNSIEINRQSLMFPSGDHSYHNPNPSPLDYQGYTTHPPT